MKFMEKQNHPCIVLYQPAWFYSVMICFKATKPELSENYTATLLFLMVSKTHKGKNPKTCIHKLKLVVTRKSLLLTNENEDIPFQPTGSLMGK